MRAALRVLMTLVVVGLICFLVLGYWAGSTWSGREGPSEGAVGSSGSANTATARERGAELGERAANAAADWSNSTRGFVPATASRWAM